MQLPKNLQYSGVKPFGFPSKMKISRFQPQGNLQQFNVNDIIRFIINAKGYWDPYSAYFQMDIDFEEMEDGNVLQLDGSAHSLIRTFILKTGSAELERIEEYDVLAQVLNDMNFSVEKRASLLNQGMGFNQQGFMANHGAKTNRQFTVADVAPVVAGKTPKERLIWNAPGTGVQRYIDFDQEPDGTNQQSQTYLGPAPKTVTPSSPIYQKYQHVFWRDLNPSKDFFSTTLIEGEQLMNPGELPQLTVIDSENQPLKEDEQRIEKDLIRDNFMLSPGVTNEDGEVEIDYSFSFCGTGYEPKYTKSYTQNVIIDGQPVKQNITRATYTIPILSGILGVLIPRESYKLIPLQALKDLIIELQLNPYAFFSSGYPPSAGETQPMGVPYRRDTWKIARCEIVAEIMEFGKEVDQAIQQQLSSSGIIFHSCTWVKGPTFSFSANTAPQGSYQINQGFESLRSIALTFNPLDYQLYPFCRKSYRISHNLTYFQIKVGLNYFPSLAIQGNGGNNVIDSHDASRGSNAEFLINLDKAFGKYLDIVGEKFINTANFALNERVFDPSNDDAWKDEDGNVQNFDTANGAPSFHENRCIGKAVYALDLEALSFDPSSVSGLKTTQMIPYEVILKSDQLNAFPRKSEMHIFHYFDFIVKLHVDGNSVLGRV